MVELHRVYVTVFAATSVLSLAVAWLAWRRRHEFRAMALTAFMLGVTVWCGTEAVLWWVPTLAEQKFWLAMTYPGVSIVVVAMLVFAFDIAGMERWRTRKRIALISIAPVVLCVVAMTNPGGLFNTTYVAQVIGPYTHYDQQAGSAFWVYLIVMYGMLLTAFAIIARTYVRSSGAKRNQCRTVLAGALIPYVVSVANQLSPHQLEGLEATAFFFTGAIFLHALVRGRLLDVNERLADKLEEVDLLANAMYDLAAGDPATTPYNRNAVSESLAREVSRSRRTGMPFALLAVGIDNLEKINNSFSPTAGEAALALVGEGLLGGSRAIDIVCRYRGDEFLIIMPASDIDNAFQRAEEFRAYVDGLTLHVDGHDMPISASIGVSSFPLHGTTETLAIAAADEALALARESGGDRTVVA